MRKLNKRIVLSILLAVALVGAGATVALSLAQSKEVINTFEAADNETEIKEEVKGTTKTVTIVNKTETPAFVRVRFELSPSDAGNMVVSDVEEEAKWKDGTDGFCYYLGAVDKGNDNGVQIKAKVSDIPDEIQTFDVLVYEESCVATSDLEDTMTDEEKLKEIKAAFAEADGNE